MATYLAWRLEVTATGSERPPNTPRICTDRSGFFGIDVVRDRDHDGAFPKEQPALEEQRALVVEDVLPPAADDELGNDDRDGVILVLTVDFVDVTNYWSDQLPVGRIDDLERYVEVELLPLKHDRRFVLFVVGDVHGAYAVRSHCLRK